MLILNAIKHRLSSEGGFAMALVMGVMLSATIFGIAAYAAAKGDIGPSAADRDRKQAYAAAEAGLNWYLSRLAVDPNYWAKCTAVGDPTAPINERWDGTGTDPRVWRAVQGSEAEYALELLPAPGNALCAQDRMIDSNGVFRIRATGEFHGVKRSIIGQFSRKRFLDFIYFTDFETSDPQSYASSQQADAQTYCGNKYRVARQNGTFPCREIQFGQNDVLRGPVHSNDSLFICNASTFGDRTTDRIESSQDPGFYRACNQSIAPNFVGDDQVGTPTLTMPTTNDSLEDQADLKLEGTNILTLNAGGTITVQRVQGSGSSLAITSTRTEAWPDNGLIYVDDEAVCSATIPLLQTYTEAGVCANVYVKGTYPRDLTIASSKDVVVNGNVVAQPGSDAMLGLIATNFIRVYHPTTAQTTSTSGCSGTNSSTPLFGPALTSGVTIEAAILSLQHGFTVDNYTCGDPLGTLTVNGAIAQKYRGAVALGGTSVSHGYVKNYVYDRRMSYRSPPLFLDPVNARWRILRQNEQLPPV